MVDPVWAGAGARGWPYARAALYMQADSVVQTPQGQVHTLTGKIDDPAETARGLTQGSCGSGIWVSGAATELLPARARLIDPRGEEGMANRRRRRESPGTV